MPCMRPSIKRPGDGHRLVYITFHPIRVEPCCEALLPHLFAACSDVGADCEQGSMCTFAHGPEELKRYTGSSLSGRSLPSTRIFRTRTRTPPPTPVPELLVSDDGTHAQGAWQENTFCSSSTLQENTCCTNIQGTSRGAAGFTAQARSVQDATLPLPHARPLLQGLRTRPPHPPPARTKPCFPRRVVSDSIVRCFRTCMLLAAGTCRDLHVAC